MEEAVFFKAIDRTIFVKATGHVTASVCPPLKNAVFERLAAEPPVEKVFVDLSGCEYMDSTFLGLLVGTQKRFAQRAPKSRVVLIGASEECMGLLRTIGVLGMVEVAEEALPFPAEIERLSGGARASARFLLDAHEDLSELSPENRKRFSALTSVLKSTVDSEERKKD